MEHWKVDRIGELLRDAGSIALRDYENPPVEWKADATAVTPADRAIEALLAARLDRPQEGIYVIGEETVDTRSEAYIQNALGGDVYIVDPIDGTAPFAAGIPLWGISIGFMRGGVLREGAIYLPVQDEAFLTCRGSLFHCVGLRTTTPEMKPYIVPETPDAARLPVCVGQYAARHWRFDFPNQLFVWSTCVGVYYGLLKGRIGAMIQQCRLWDMAGGLPLLQAAGFAITPPGDAPTWDLDMIAGGKIVTEAGPQRWSQREPVVIARDAARCRAIWNQVKEKNNI